MLILKLELDFKSDDIRICRVRCVLCVLRILNRVPQIHIPPFPPILIQLRLHFRTDSVRVQQTADCNQNHHQSVGSVLRLVLVERDVDRGLVDFVEQRTTIHCFLGLLQQRPSCAGVGLLRGTQRTPHETRTLESEALQTRAVYRQLHLDTVFGGGPLTDTFQKVQCGRPILIDACDSDLEVVRALQENESLLFLVFSVRFPERRPQHAGTHETQEGNTQLIDAECGQVLQVWGGVYVLIALGQYAFPSLALGTRHLDHTRHLTALFHHFFQKPLHIIIGYCCNEHKAPRTLDRPPVRPIQLGAQSPDLALEGPIVEGRPDRDEPGSKWGQNGFVGVK